MRRRLRERKTRGEEKSQYMMQVVDETDNKYDTRQKKKKHEKKIKRKKNTRRREKSKANT